MTSEREIALGIIGLGNMGRSHADRIKNGEVPGLRLAAVADADAGRLAAYSGSKTFDSGYALIESGEVEAVLIATPHYSHTPLGIAALKAGLHLLVEKPISVHKQDCEKLVQAYRPDSGLVFAAMFNQRVDPRYVKLRELIQTGALGEIRRIHWTITDWFRTEFYYQSAGWRATWAGEGGGVLLNQCPHNLDLWQWLFGMPERVIARCQFGRFHDIEVEDSVTALMEYASGTQGVFVTSTGESPGTNRLEVIGDNGKVLVESPADSIVFLRTEHPVPEFSRNCRKLFASPPSWNISIPLHGPNESHLGILKNFVKAIRGEEELIAPGVEGIHSVELANAMLLSTFQDTPVQLPLDGAVYAAELQKRVDTSRSKRDDAASRPAVRS